MMLADHPAFQKKEEIFPVGVIGGKKLCAHKHRFWGQRNPSDWEEKIGRIPLAKGIDVACASRAAMAAQREWQESSITKRKEVLRTLASLLLKTRAELAGTMALEIGKPVALGEAEARFAAELAMATARSIDMEERRRTAIHRRFQVRRRPVGLIAILTPWNNPVAIPIGKLAPAIGYGNGVIWKAAPQAPRSSIIVHEALQKAGCPPGLVSLLFGGKGTAERLVLDPCVQAVSLTGSIAAGRSVGALAMGRLKPTQLELGGNNAVIIMADCDIDRVAAELAGSAFSFSGQRCTAPRRFILHEAVRERFPDALVDSVQSLRLGSPADPSTQVGPLISRKKQKEMRDLSAKSVAEGAKIICGGRIPNRLKHGCWFEPTVLFSPTQASPCVQEESFGPVVVIQIARDIRHAVSLLNGVPQGLAASLYSHDRACQKYFLSNAHCGVLKLNQTTLGVFPDAPFGGWKASGSGWFEHGVWDREFYTRLQTVYA